MSLVVPNMCLQKLLNGDGIHLMVSQQLSSVQSSLTATQLVVVLSLMSKNQ